MISLNYKSFVRGMMLVIPLILGSCTSSDSPVHSEDEDVRILFAVDRFEDAAMTKTTMTDEGIVWAAGDTIGIFPYEGFQEPFVIPEDQVGKASATFDGGYWALKEGLYYNAYYPFDLRNFASGDMQKKIPLSYQGQYQIAGQINTAAYDFTYSDWQQAPEAGSVTFRFHHIGCLIVVNMIYPATAEYAKLGFRVLDANGNGLQQIPLKGIYDLTYSMDREPEAGSTYVKIPYVPTESEKSVSIEMSLYSDGSKTAGIAGTEGESCTFYMMMPPVDLSSSDVQTQLVLVADNATKYICTVPPTNFQSGKRYTYTLTPVQDLDADFDVNTDIGDWEGSDGYSGTPSPDFD